MKPTIIAVALFLVVGLIANPVHAFQDGGPKTLQIGNAELIKNGFGNREKMFLSLYEATLYLKQKANGAAAIVNADEEMAVRIKITSRFVSQKKLVAALDEGFKAATGGDTSKIATDIQQFRACFADPIKVNDVFILSYLPNNGVVVYKNNTKKGVVGDVEFKKAVFGIWLGSKPVDAGLKTGMLGK